MVEFFGTKNMLWHCMCHGTVWSNVQPVFKQWNFSVENSKKG